MTTQSRRGRKPKVDRDQVFALLSEDWSQSDIARHFCVSPQAISKIVTQAEAVAHASVQPVAPDDLELVPPFTVRPRVSMPEAQPAPIQPKATNEPGSEWRGIALGQTLAERHHQLRIMQGSEVARDFARRETWHLSRSGVSVEALSAQFDLPTSEIETLIAEARERALSSIDTYDARLSLSAALEDITVARREALRVLNSASSPPSARASARHMLLRIAQAEIELAVSVEQFRAARGLLGGDTGENDMDALSFWISIPKKGAQR
jgi:hypothetical protein